MASFAGCWQWAAFAHTRDPSIADGEKGAVAQFHFTGFQLQKIGALAVQGVTAYKLAPFRGDDDRGILFATLVNRVNYSELRILFD